MAMSIMVETAAGVVGGVDTHQDEHVAVVVDSAGRVRGTEAFSNDRRGHRALHRWMQRHGELIRVGVEGTGSYGAGLNRFLAGHEVEVVEVPRPDRRRRRLRGKSDPVDAEAAARAALADDLVATPKRADGRIEAIRALKIPRNSAVKARTQCINQMRSLIDTAPDQLREQLRPLTTRHLVETAARFRPGRVDEPAAATRMSLKRLARRCQHLNSELAEIDAQLTQLVTDTAPQLLNVFGVGTETAATLLIAAGDNPDRITTEAGFAALAGVSPVDRSSGRQQRHSLNRGGNRDANRALWRIALVRLSHDPTTKAYLAKRTTDGKTKREAIRCLKRYIARELHPLIHTAVLDDR